MRKRGKIVKVDKELEWCGEDNRFKTKYVFHYENDEESDAELLEHFSGDYWYSEYEKDHASSRWCATI